MARAAVGHRHPKNGKGSPRDRKQHHGKRLQIEGARFGLTGPGDGFAGLKLIVNERALIGSEVIQSR